MKLQALDKHASASAASHLAYDVFVVHADAATDEAFVNGYLLANLGLAPERVLRLQTLELGQFITKQSSAACGRAASPSWCCQRRTWMITGQRSASSSWRLRA
ncbi:MAG TPA: hypothetical protein VHN14_23370 [Kofleriaceae bacterium]|jgi:hypothetical protein|nr:hypothetical protein [Kofleriaceae bacterium]